MSDGFFFALAGLAAAAMILIALVWPQGLGTPTRVPATVQQWIAVEAPAKAEPSLKGRL